MLRDGPRPGAWNMALDETLARRLGPGRAVLRLYGWTCPTVSFGRNEPARDVYREPAEAGVGGSPSDVALDFVRRPTGGRAVLHDAEVTYAVVAPFDAMGGARRAYRRINAALADGLRSLGADVGIAGDGGDGLPSLDAGPCFQGPAPGEVIAGGRKLVGSAQARIGRNLLQHGSIILRGDQSALSALATPPASPSMPSRPLPVTGATTPASATLPGRPATLEELIGNVEPETVERVLARSVTEAFGGHAVESVVSREEDDDARALVASRYGRSSWTWRR